MSESNVNVKLERSGSLSHWFVGWVSCAVSSLFAVMLILMDWQRRTPLGKFAAIAFLLFLALFPLRIASLLKAKKEVSPGWAFGLGYILLFLALHAFGPLAHAR